MQVDRAKVADVVSNVRATSPDVDVLDALEIAGQAVRAACDHGGTIYLEDSGLQEIGPLNFRVSALIAADPTDVVKFLKREHELPDLAGITVVLVGIGDTAPPQSLLSIAQQNNLIAIWSAIVRAGGAKAVDIDSSPRGGSAPLHVPYVASVPIFQAKEWSPTVRTFTIFTLGTTITFQPNTAVFIPEGAGRCQGVSACSFAGVGCLQGMANWPRGAAFLRAGASLVRAGGLGQGPGRSPAASAAPEASLTRVPASR